MARRGIFAALEVQKSLGKVLCIMEERVGLAFCRKIEKGYSRHCELVFGVRVLVCSAGSSEVDRFESFGLIYVSDTGAARCVGGWASPIAVWATCVGVGERVLNYVTSWSGLVDGYIPRSLWCGENEMR